MTFEVGPAPMPPVAPRPSRRAPFTALGTFASTLVFGVGWPLAAWVVNTCPEQRITADDADFVTARTILGVATLIWAGPAIVGFVHARRHRQPASGYLTLAAALLVIGGVVTVGLSSGELCLS